MRRQLLCCLPLALLVHPPTALAAPDEPGSPAVEPRIVNGLNTSDHPSVVDILFASASSTLCTGTLIGCETVLTAAHCVCSGSTAATCGTPDPTDYLIFTQHFGLSDVDSVSVHPAYAFGSAGDAAILKLAQPVTGIAPSPINTTASPAPGSAGLLVGFGLTDGSLGDAGIKRRGLVTTAACTVVPGSTHVCWNFTEPVGPPGEDSNTCSGDSGGPLFINFGAGNRVAGVTSGGISADCQPADSSFDTDVFVIRDWIQTIAGSDLDNTSCGDLPQAGQPGALILAGEGTIDAMDPTAQFLFDVPGDTSLLRVVQNGEDGPFAANDFDLYVRFGEPPTLFDYDCRPFLEGSYEPCEFPSPTAGTWHILVNRFNGAGEFQMTATLFDANSEIFVDGFESGDLSAWSGSAP